MMFNVPKTNIICERNKENCQSLWTKKARSISNKSIKKPLVDRTNFDLTDQSRDIKKSCSKKVKTDFKITDISNDEKFCIFDENYFIEEPDSYEDIIPKKHKLSESDLNQIVKSVCNQKLPSTPPPSLLLENFALEVELPNNDSAIGDDELHELCTLKEPNILMPNFYLNDTDPYLSNF